MIKAVIFDLDKTLHAPSTELINAVRKNIDLFMQSKKLSNSYAKSIELLELIQQHYASIELGISVLFDIKADEFMNFVFDAVEPEKYVQPDALLLEKLQKLKVPKIIYTGGTKKFCNKILAALGIANCFDKVFTRDDVPAIKSSVSSLRFIVEQLNISPNEILMVGDNFRQDVLPAQLVGLQTLHVTPELFENKQFLNDIFDRLEEKNA